MGRPGGYSGIVIGPAGAGGIMCTAPRPNPSARPARHGGPPCHSSTIAGRHFVAGHWLPPRAGHFPSRSPANRDDVVGVFPSGTPGRRQRRRRRRPGRVSRRGGAPAASSAPSVRPPRPARQARDRRPRPADGPRVRQDHHRVPGRGGRRAAHDPVRLRHRAACRSATCSPREIAEKDAFMRRKPWGVVAVITPWNFPFAVPLWMLGPSLLEGNTAVFKPSRRHAGHRPAARRAVRRSRLPARASINLVHGDGDGRRGAGAQPRRQRRAASPAATTSASASSSCPPSLPRPHRRRRDGQQERRHRLRGRPARPGGQRGRHQRASRRAASAASRRAASWSTSR